MRDLDCYCDVEHEMRFLTVAFKNVQSAQICRYIGVETYSKYQQYKDFVGKYFKLRKPENSEEIPYSLRKDYYIGNKVNPKINIWLFDAVMDFNVIECCDTMNKMKRIWHLLYTTKKNSEQNKINKIFYKNVFLDKKNEDAWYRINYDVRDENGDYLKEPYYNSSRYTFMMLLSKKDYHKCDFTLKHVDYVDTFTNEHNGLRMFLKNCNNLMEHYELIKFIKSLVRKEGEWVIGALEGSSTFLTTTRDLNNNLLMNVIGKEVILRVVDKYKKENSGRVFVKNLDNGDLKYYDHFSSTKNSTNLDVYTPSNVPFDMVTKGVTTWKFTSSNQFVLNGSSFYNYTVNTNGIFSVNGLENGSTRIIEVLNSTENYINVKVYESNGTNGVNNFSFYTVLTFVKVGFVGTPTEYNVPAGYVYSGVIGGGTPTTNQLNGTTWVLTNVNHNFSNTPKSDTVHFVSNTSYTLGSNPTTYTYQLYPTFGNWVFTLNGFTPINGLTLSCTNVNANVFSSTPVGGTVTLDMYDNFNTTNNKYISTFKKI